jgi:hypothetical protein
MNSDFVFIQKICFMWIVKVIYIHSDTVVEDAHQYLEHHVYILKFESPSYLITFYHFTLDYDILSIFWLSWQ